MKVLQIRRKFATQKEKKENLSESYFFGRGYWNLQEQFREEKGPEK